MIDRWHIRLLLAMVLVGVAARAQNATEPAQVHDLIGAVYNSATNAPVAHALVQIVGRSYPAAFTDGDGRFEIPGVHSGQVTLQAEKPGYFSPQSLSAGVPIPAAIMVGGSTGDVRLKLIPEGHIEGRITNSDDEPIAELQVSVIGEQIVAGWKQQVYGGNASTNADGRFRVDGLKPGRYFVRTAARQMFLSAPVDSVNIGYAQQYYPAAPDADWSQAIEVKAGDTVQANMQLPPARFYHISGTVNGFSGEGTYVSLQTDSGEAQGGVAAVDRETGKFELSFAFSGTWKLVARAQQKPGSSSAYGEQYIRVSNANVTGVRIDMHAVPNIPFEIDMPVPVETSTHNIGMPQVQLVATDHSASQPMFWAQTDNSKPEPSQFFAGVPPGTYHVSVPPLAGMCVQSISSGNTDLESGLLAVQDGIATQPIHVVLGTACANLTGVVSSNNGDAAGMVVLLPVSAPASPAILMTMPNRSFARRELSPGDYRIFAVSDLAGLEYANPQAVLNIPSQEIHLDANQTTQVNLELYRREQP
jgi:Carboxypeptidase regulatory-like domain